MATELICLLWSTLLGFLHVSAQVMVQRIESPHVPYDPNREKEAVLGPKAGRAKRALVNFLETYPLFIALVAVTMLAGTGDQLTAWGAILYLAARAAYLPLYIVGIAPIRSLFWGLSFVGLGMLFVGAMG